LVVEYTSLRKTRLDERAAGREIRIGHGCEAPRQFAPVDRGTISRFVAHHGESVFMQEAKMRRVRLPVDQKRAPPAQ
jgi:hypothetical protein